MNQQIEEWKDIHGYEGLYQISSYGRVYSYPRKHTHGGIIKPSSTLGGYLSTHLSKDGVVKTLLVHRVVAEHFLDNPEGLPEVNHKDENKTNNHVCNLEYCTRQYNQNYGTCRQRAAQSHDYQASAWKAAMNHDYKEVARKKSKPVIQRDKDRNFIREWGSLKEAARQNNYSCGNLSAACNGRQKTAYGYIWEFARSEK